MVYNFGQILGDSLPNQNIVTNTKEVDQDRKQKDCKKGTRKEAMCSVNVPLFVWSVSIDFVTP